MSTKVTKVITATVTDSPVVGKLVLSAEAKQSQRRDNAKELASGYTPQKRALEYASIAVFAACWFAIVARTVEYLRSPFATSNELLWAIPLVIAGLGTADFLSGIAHWTFDTWGSTTTPVFGPFIRSFREHHIDAMAMTRHDFVETNGDTALILMPIILPFALFAYIDTAPGAWIFTQPWLHIFMVPFILLTALTNQTHKMAHSLTQPFLIRLLMNCRIILNPAHHRRHHSGQYDRNYCITTGWLNGPLDAIDFWRRAESFITAVTGLEPRVNDLELTLSGQ